MTSAIVRSFVHRLIDFMRRFSDRTTTHIHTHTLKCKSARWRSSIVHKPKTEQRLKCYSIYGFFMQHFCQPVFTVVAHSLLDSHNTLDHWSFVLKYEFPCAQPSLFSVFAVTSDLFISCVAYQPFCILPMTVWANLINRLSFIASRKWFLWFLHGMTAQSDRNEQIYITMIPVISHAADHVQ